MNLKNLVWWILGIALTLFSLFFLKFSISNYSMWIGKFYQISSITLESIALLSSLVIIPFISKLIEKKSGLKINGRIKVILVLVVVICIISSLYFIDLGAQAWTVYE